MSKPHFDSRFVSAEDFELRMDEDGKRLHGAAPPYGQWSQPIMGSFVEMFERGAFGDSDVIATHEHKDELLLGRTESGTLELRDDDDARHYAVDLPNTVDGDRVRELHKRGDLQGSSFEFRSLPKADLWFRDADEMVTWLQTNRDMGEEAARKLAGDSDLERRYLPAGSAIMRQIGPVARPAYPQTDLAMRSRDAWHEELQSAETAPADGPTPTPRRTWAANALQLLEADATIPERGE